MIARIKRFVPLPRDDRDRLFDKFLSVTRATLKGTIVIGAIQGMLGGVAFWVLGISGAIFWGVVMMVLSVLPVVGGALVWVPTAIVLALTGDFLKALLLTAFCGLVVGSVDNVLRPRLVGRDTEMHDLMILFSTLGGITAFGAVGFILGPIIAALFQTVWELMDAAFDDIWPRRQSVPLPTIAGDPATVPPVAPPPVTVAEPDER
jgi:predicted PurR-regulated permease PerM